MKGYWHCTDCGERIAKDAIDEHESNGHHVRGHFRPDRLLAGDPEMIGSQVNDGDGGGV
ncbi:hypothetical protein SAMN05444422_10969 [Halobiforma haloterrestris]|uniref:Uncharacterized protein n=1 Tax=Natronobacterium haloterrestre TaxID=148448 RepID=A0A1I1JRT2_NATHA|nr:hypothetical protein [Halobiforma haloterrestris]SFC49228.1 hypothetical protein SAMN05444422_10969 [Halobiforma haloterrestris]